MDKVVRRKTRADHKRLSRKPTSLLRNESEPSAYLP
jgi:hypothetical protein